MNRSLHLSLTKTLLLTLLVGGGLLLAAPRAADAVHVVDHDETATVDDYDNDEYGALGQELRQSDPRAGSNPANPAEKTSCNVFSDGLGCALYWLLDTVSDFLINILLTLVLLVFEGAVQIAFVPLSSTAFVQTGFGITVGIANLFFILILLWIAIATIFDFGPFTAKQLLPRLILAALLINFSLPIGNAFIRLSNGIGGMFYRQLQSPLTAEEQQRQGVVGQYLPGAPFASRVLLASKFNQLKDTRPEGRATTLADVSQQINRDCTGLAAAAGGPLYCLSSLAGGFWRFAWGQPVKDTEVVTIALTATLFKLVMTPLLLFVLLAGAVFLIIRTISLAFLLIVGPLAFLFMILPATRSFYNQWWERLAKWSFFFPAFMFFIFLSIQAGSGLAQAFVVPGTSDRMPIIMQYVLMVGLLLGSLIAANQTGIYGASTVTGWGKKLAGAAGGYAKARGWKYAGKAAEAVTGTRAMQALGRVPIIGTAARAAATATMKKGAGVEKKDVEFYTKLNDRQLAKTLPTMRGAQAEAIWNALPAKRQREAKDGLEVLARDRKWRNAPPERPPERGQTAAPQTAAEAVQAQNQAIANQVLPVIQGLGEFKQLPQDLQAAITQAIQQAAQNLPAGVTPESGAQAIRQAILDALRGQGDTLQVEAAIRSDATRRQVQTAVGGAIQIHANETIAGRLRDVEDTLEGKADKEG